MKRLLVALIMLAAFFCLPVKEEAAGKTLRIPGPACQKGNDIYYCYTMGGLRMNLMKINKKTNKVTKIVSYKNKGKDTNAFENLNVKGNAIYAAYDLVCGTGASDSYICRIDSKKKTKKLLTKGRNPVVMGKKIYFIKTAYNKEYDSDKDMGIYVMNLSGKKIKKVCKMPVSGLYELGTDGKNFVYSYYNKKGKLSLRYMTKKGKKLGAYKKTESSFCSPSYNLRSTVGNKQYYIAGNRVVCVDKTTNETTVLADFGTGISSYVDNFQVFHDVILVRGVKEEYIPAYKEMAGKGYIYMIHLNDLSKVLLKKYNSGE